MEEPTNRSRLHGELEELVALNLRHEKASKKAAIVVAGLLLGPVFAFCGVTLFVVLVEEDMALIEARLRRDLDIPRLEEAFHRQTKEGFDRVNKDRPDLPYDERFKLYQARNDEAREALFRAEDQWLFQRSRVSERRSMRSILVLLLSLPVPLAGLLWWRRKRMATAANLLATAVSQFQAEHPDLVRSWGGSEALASSERVRQIQVHLRRHSD